LGVPVLLTLVGLQVYELLGGIYPLQLNRPADLLPPLAALVVGAFSSFLAGVPMFWLVPAVFGAGATSGRPSVGFARQFLSTIGLTRIASPFAILAAVIYTRLGAGWYLFLILGAVGATVLARFLSDSSARARQQAREMAGLEGLSRAILAAPPDISQLPALLAERLPGMLPNLGYLIWLTSGEVLAVAPPELSERYLEAIKTALADPAGSPHHRHIQLPADPSFPENGQPALIVPIQAEEGEPLGAVCLTFFDDALAPARYEPVAHSLAAEVAAAWARVTAHSQALANERMSQELAIAGRIQGSFLPAAVPALPGWDIAAALVPARQTSGDFYDFIPLPGDRLGLLVADVADKGTGAALYMALSRTLIRTYALAQPEAPAQALAQANERILQDTVSDQFVTVFYGVLDRASGQFTYCNAGHNPAFWWQNGASPVPLGNTGIPLGMFPGMAWEARTVQLNADDLLVLYTDGVTEAQNEQQALYEEMRLQAVCQAGCAAPAGALLNAIIADVQAFAGAAPQADDITLMIVRRLPA
ncbi:MAG: PP2C family protein-serine/threonine phosphatase, partial [Anaerolineales bacterium]|nr:PP2C family protein-serine/threonine phosphatase [Anaerolineales bacterium]